MARNTLYIMDMPWPAALMAGLSALAVLAVVGARIVWWPMSIPTGSMQPTLVPGDLLFIDKFAYRDGAVPRRGDVIAFRPITGFDQSNVYVKRVAGGPGDVVQMKAGVLYVNGAALSGPVSEGRVVEPFRDDFGMTVVELSETPRPGVTHRIWNRDETPGDDTEPYEVPPGNLFLMGDDRDNSRDSRFELDGFGFVPVDEVVGRVAWKADQSVGLAAVK